MTDAQLTITGNRLTIIEGDGSAEIILPALPYESVVHVWSVPTDYRPSGYFVSTTRAGAPRDIPACDLRQTQVLGRIAYPADESAALAAEVERLHLARVKALEAAREAGFQHNGHLVSSDAKSQGLLGQLNTEAALALMSGDQAALDQFAEGLGQGWRATEGAIVASNAMEFRAMMQSWYTHVAMTDAISQGHKEAIDSANTLAELETIDVTGGY